MSDTMMGKQRACVSSLLKVTAPRASCHAVLTVVSTCWRPPGPGGSHTNTHFTGTNYRYKVIRYRYQTGFPTMHDFTVVTFHCNHRRKNKMDASAKKSTAWAAQAPPVEILVQSVRAPVHQPSTQHTAPRTSTSWAQPPSTLSFDRHPHRRHRRALEIQCAPAATGSWRDRTEPRRRRLPSPRIRPN